MEVQQSTNRNPKDKEILLSLSFEEARERVFNRSDWRFGGSCFPCVRSDFYNISVEIVLALQKRVNESVLGGQLVTVAEAKTFLGDNFDKNYLSQKLFEYALIREIMILYIEAYRIKNEELSLQGMERILDALKEISMGKFAILNLLRKRLPIWKINPALLNEDMLSPYDSALIKGDFRLNFSLYPLKALEATAILKELYQSVGPEMNLEIETFYDFSAEGNILIIIPSTSNQSSILPLILKFLVLRTLN
jgi:hypothetical protein